MPNVRAAKLSVAESEAHEHPLFPVDDDEDTIPVIDFIQVCRWENGKIFYGPVFPASELQSQADLYSRFGGGEFELWGRKHAKHDPTVPGQRTKKIRFHVPGRSRPMSDDVPEEPEPLRAREPAAQAGGLNEVLMLLIQQSQAAAQAASAQAADSSRQFLQLMVSMMGNSKTEAASTTQMMMQLSQQQNQSMVQMMMAMMSAKGGGPEELAKYAELLRTLGMGPGVATSPKEKVPAENESIGSMLENAADAIQGLVQLKGGLTLPTEGASEPAPAGSAAEFLQRKIAGG